MRRLGCELGLGELALRLVFEPLTWIGFFLAPDELSAAAYVGALRFLIAGRSDSWRARGYRVRTGRRWCTLWGQS